MITPEESKAFKYLKKYSLSLGIDEVEFSFEYEYSPATDVEVDFFTSTSGRGYYNENIQVPQAIAVKIFEFYNREIKDKIEDVWQNFPGDDEFSQGGMYLKFNFGISEVSATLWADYYGAGDEDVEEWEVDEDTRLAECIKNIKGKFSLSYYDFPKLSEWFPKDEYKWEQKDFAKAAAAKKDGKQNMGTELLIKNY